MAKDKNTKFNPKNGQDVIEYAKGKTGVEIHQKKNGMVQIKTPNGSMQVTDSRSEYSEHDKSNVRKWLKIIGLLCLVATFLYILSATGVI